MAFNVSKRPQADRDIEECFVFIAEGDLDGAVKFLVAVEDSLDELSRFPMLGREGRHRDGRLLGYRIWKVRGYDNYLLFYQLRADTVELFRVLQSSRDIESIFD